MVANRNLNQTGTENETVYYVGNILIDTIRYNRNRLIKPVWFSVLGLKEHEYILLTLNRHVLLNNKENLQELMETLLKKANGHAHCRTAAYLYTRRNQSIGDHRSQPAHHAYTELSLFRLICESGKSHRELTRAM